MTAPRNCGFALSTKRPAILAALLAAAGAWQVAAAEPWSLRPQPVGLPEYFDCVRTTGGLLISAHRGGPAPGYPENAIETFAHTLERIPAMLEIDVATSRDGTLVLMHDSTLERTSTGTGKVADRSDAELRGYLLKDNAGTVTSFHIPTLRQALDFARDRTILVLDRKDPTTYDAIIDAVVAARSENYVVFATYALDDVKLIGRRHPALVIGAPIESVTDLKEVESTGADMRRILAWTGVTEHRPWLYPLLAEKGIESMFGTLGNWPGSFDNLIAERGEDSLYDWLTTGVQVIATDRAFVVADTLAQVRATPQRCNAPARTATP